MEERTGSTATSGNIPHVVIIGGGFGGLTAAQALAREAVRVTLVDRTNHHLFQPLLYQVATAGLSPAEIASPIRSVLSRQRNVSVRLDEVERIDLAARSVHCRDGVLTYDFLIVATGATNNYFGHDEWEEFAPGMKSIDDAVELRRRVLLAFEAAERTTAPSEREALLTFVVIGGGPTGVEMAGALAELSRFVVAKDFRAVDPSATRVLLLEGGPRVLPSFPEDLSAKAVLQLRELGVEVLTNTRVTRIDASAVHVGEQRIPSVTVLWAAGVRATPLLATLGVPLDRAGRAVVEQDCALPGHPEAFVIGDAAAFVPAGEHQPLPGLSPVAMQQARHVAREIALARKGEARENFHYKDKGSMATIGRSRAVAQAGKLKLAGFMAWLAWLLVHVFFLIGFRNRFVVMFSWAWSYFTYGRGARLITGHRLEAGAPRLEHAGGASAVLPRGEGAPAVQPAPPAA